jgi:hypothetical protein
VNRADFERKRNARAADRQDAPVRPKPAAPAHVVWLPEPRPLFPGCGIKVVGVMSDAPLELLEELMGQ